jgi:hypothetical protein
LHAKLKVLSPDYSLLQVKEKFGGLRYYTALDGVDDATAKAFFDLIEEAEAKSFHVCERCGEPGVLSRKGGQRGWLKTLCPHCAESMGFQPLDHEANK